MYFHCAQLSYRQFLSLSQDVYKILMKPKLSSIPFCISVTLIYDHSSHQTESRRHWWAQVGSVKIPAQIGFRAFLHPCNRIQPTIASSFFDTTYTTCCHLQSTFWSHQSYVVAVAGPEVLVAPGKSENQTVANKHSKDHQRLACDVVVTVWIHSCHSCFFIGHPCVGSFCTWDKTSAVSSFKCSKKKAQSAQTHLPNCDWISQRKINKVYNICLTLMCVYKNIYDIYVYYVPLKENENTHSPHGYQSKLWSNCQVVTQDVLVIEKSKGTELLLTCW